MPQSAGSPSNALARKVSFAASPPLLPPAATQMSRHALSLQRRHQSRQNCGPGGAGGAGIACHAQPTRLRPSAGRARLARFVAGTRNPGRRPLQRARCGWRRGRHRHDRHRAQLQPRAKTMRQGVAEPPADRSLPRGAPPHAPTRLASARRYTHERPGASGQNCGDIALAQRAQNAMQKERRASSAPKLRGQEFSVRDSVDVARALAIACLHRERPAAEVA